MENTIQEIQEWYLANCNGDWEHSFGVKIHTLDNPGWAVSIDLEDTIFENEIFREVKVNYAHNTDWYVCTKKENKFEGRGGPKQLEKILKTFLDWAACHNK